MKRSILVIAVLVTANWLAFPAAASADNCQNMGGDERSRACSIPEKVFGFFTGLALMAGAAINRFAKETKARMDKAASEGDPRERSWGYAGVRMLQGKGPQSAPPSGAPPPADESPPP